MLFSGPSFYSSRIRSSEPSPELHDGVRLYPAGLLIGFRGFILFLFDGHSKEVLS